MASATLNHAPQVTTTTRTLDAHKEVRLDLTPEEASLLVALIGATDFQGMGKLTSPVRESLLSTEIASDAYRIRFVVGIRLINQRGTSDVDVRNALKTLPFPTV